MTRNEEAGINAVVAVLEETYGADKPGLQELARSILATISVSPARDDLYLIDEMD